MTEPVRQTTEKAESQQMKVPDVLAEAFDTLVDAPNGIPKLREMILDLAVRGKLVPQDPNDEPATELKRHLQKAKEASSKKKYASIKLPPIKKELERYLLPNNWERVRLGNCVRIING
ncbi:MAG: hypothetical protein ACOCZS_01390, partial [Verrucomicrobiota bacterium]